MYRLTAPNGPLPQRYTGKPPRIDEPAGTIDRDQGRVASPSPYWTRFAASASTMGVGPRRSLPGRRANGRRERAQVRGTATREHVI